MDKFITSKKQNLAENLSEGFIFDPNQWKTIDIKLRDLLVENGPIRVDYLNFPIDKNSRHFSSMHYI